MLTEANCDYLVMGCPLGLIGVPIAIAIAMYVHGKKIVVQRSTCSGIGAKWHIAIIPVIDILDSLRLTLRMMMMMRVPVVMMMHLD